MQKNIIVAISDNNAIGKDNDLLWHISEDMKFFRRTTLGSPVIMGRKTFESFPNGALPGRRNIVITRQDDYSANGIELVNSLQSAIDAVTDTDEAFAG